MWSHSGMGTAVRAIDPFTSEVQVSYETSVRRLEEIVAALTGGTRPLAESLGLFQEGVELLKEADDALSVAEYTARTLLDDAGPTAMP